MIARWVWESGAALAINREGGKGVDVKPSRGVLAG